MNNLVTTVQAMYEAFGKGDIPFILNLVSDDAQWEHWADNSAQNAGVPWMVARKGKAGAMEYFVSISKLQIKEFSILSIMANETQVAAEFVLEADVPATGKHYRDEEMHLWTFNKEGKIIRLRHYLDTAKHIAVAK